MHELSAVIKRPLVTERSTSLISENKYVFEVAIWANKVEIKKSVEHFFGVKVVAVNTLLQRGKKRRLRQTMGRKPDWKKAVVTLKEGETIGFFESM